METEPNLSGWLGLVSSVRLPMRTRCPLFEDPPHSIEAGPPLSEEDTVERSKAEDLLRQVWWGDLVGLSEGIELLDPAQKKKFSQIKVRRAANGKDPSIADMIRDSQDGMTSQRAWSSSGFRHAEWASSFETLFWLGNRRRRMFRTATAERTYDIGLCPVLAQSDTDASLRYTVVPVATLYRKHTRYFRRLLTISLFLIPQQVSQPDQDGRRVKRFPLSIKNARATLKGELTFSAAGAWSGSCSVFQIAEHYLKMALGAMLEKDQASLPKEIAFEIAQACDPMTNGATLKTAVLETPLTLDQVQRWNRGAADQEVEEMARQLMYRPDVVVDSADVRDGALSNQKLGSRDYVGVFDVGESLLFTLLPKDNVAEYGDLASWSMMHIRGLSTLREMIWIFYQEVAITPDRTLLSNVTMEFVEDFEQFYGLDWRGRDYEREFQRLKRLDGTAAKFESLRQKLTSLGEHLNTEANFALQHIVMIATAVGLLIGAYQGFNTDKLSGRLIAALAVGLVLIVLFRLFEPRTLSATWRTLRYRLRYMDES